MGETGISEEASENHTERKRGRPRHFSKEEMQRVDASSRLMGQKRTPRAQQNFIYMSRAMRVIEPLLPKHPELRWLIDPEAIMRGEGHLQQSIMQELGRVRDDRMLVALALRICELRPTSHDAVKRLRQARLKHGAKGSVDELTERLRCEVNEYLRWRPHLTLTDAKDAVWRLYGLFDEQ
jgi:hypothetical protein